VCAFQLFPPKNLIGIAIAMGYTSEIKSLFDQPKYSTMEELTQIRKNQNKKKSYFVHLYGECRAVLSARYA
jgi:hypothetical protein